MNSVEGQAHAGYRACYLVGVPGDFNKAAALNMVHEAGYHFDCRSLPYELQRAGAALLTAAVVHTLNSPENAPPKTMQWAGGCWYLNHWGSRRVHVSPCPSRSFGIVTGYDFYVPEPTQSYEEPAKKQSASADADSQKRDVRERENSLCAEPGKVVV